MTILWYQSAMNNSQSGQGAVSNILAVAGFIILIAIIVWGAFHFLNLASSGFSSFLSRSDANAITLTLSSEEVSSGQPLDVAWDYSPAEGSGNYTLLYQCRDGFLFRAINTAGVVSAVPCGDPYTVGDSSTKGVRLIPTLSASTSVDVPFTVIFMLAGTSTGSTTTEAATHPQGNATVTVKPQAEDTATTVTPPTTTTPPTQTPPASTGTVVPAGKPDLAVRIIAIGVIDMYTNQFVNRMPTSQNDIAAVKFDIANNGTGSSGAWYFTAQLPTTPAAPYTSPQQRSLAPGDHIENVLRFNQMASGGGTFSVSVDPYNSVSETNESNNYATQWVSGGYGYYPMPYQPYPQPYVY